MRKSIIFDNFLQSNVGLESLMVSFPIILLPTEQTNKNIKEETFLEGVHRLKGNNKNKRGKKDAVSVKKKMPKKD